MHLRQSTASQAVVIGPFVDSTDGNTAETGLTIDASDIRLSKNGANIVAKNSGGGTHDELGYYTITLDATDTNTVGRLQLMVHVAGALPVYHEFEVLEEAVYDALYASSAPGPLPANSTGSGLSAIPWNSAWDAEVQSECADALNAYDPPTNAEMEARTLAAASYATATALATVDNVVDAIKAVTDNLPDSGALSSLATASALSTVDGNVDAIKAVTDNLPDSGALTSLATAAALATVDGNVDAILEDTGTTLPAALSTIDSNVDAILDDTGTSGVVVASGSKTGYSLSADQSGVTIGTVNALGTQAKADVNAAVDTALNTAIPGTPTAGSINDVLKDLDAVLPASTIATATDVSAVETDTQDIQSRLPAALNNGCMPADIRRINDVEITGDGSDSPFDVAP